VFLDKLFISTYFDIDVLAKMELGGLRLKEDLAQPIIERQKP
jgi:hypothetical protein